MGGGQHRSYQSSFFHPIAASGPGANRVHGFLANTHLFDVMLAAMGWKKED
jgi:alkaline phosphatase